MNFPIEIHQKYHLMAEAIHFNPADVVEHHTRGHGHGGQNINKATNCVELTHQPTGIVVRYQHHRGLLQNRKEAWELLILKIEEHVKGEQSQMAHERFKIRKQKQRRSRKSKEKILQDKRERSETKDLRKPPLDQTGLPA